MIENKVVDILSKNVKEIFPDALDYDVSVFYTIPFENMESWAEIDILVFKENKLIGIEAKGDIDDDGLRRGIGQAIDYRTICSQVYLAVPDSMVSRVESMISHTDIGLINVKPNGDVQILIESEVDDPADPEQQKDYFQDETFSEHEGVIAKDRDAYLRIVIEGMKERSRGKETRITALRTLFELMPRPNCRFIRRAEIKEAAIANVYQGTATGLKWGLEDLYTAGIIERRHIGREHAYRIHNSYYLSLQRMKDLI